MGKIDTTTKEYMGNPVVFADAFNQLLTSFYTMGIKGSTLPG